MLEHPPHLILTRSISLTIYEGPNTSPINKYHKWYINIIHNRQVNVITREDGYCERHHIIPKSLDGSNKSSNLVNLTAKEHFIVHILLPKFLEGQAKYKMLNALIRFRYNERQYTNARLYESSRIHQSNFKSYRNIESGEYLMFERDPGEGWIKEGYHKNKTPWFNTRTGVYKFTKKSPGSEWIKQGASKGMKFWKSEDGDFVRSETSPGEGWINCGVTTGTKSWRNRETNENIMSSERPGDVWDNIGANSGYQYWYNENDDVFTSSDVCPGEGWIKRGLNVGMKTWKNIHTGKYTRSIVKPGNEWIKESFSVGMLHWMNVETGERTSSKKCPGEGWIRRGHNVGEIHNSFIGYFCHQEYGVYVRCEDLANVVNISHTGLQKIFKKGLDTVINRISYSKNTYLKSLPFDPIGMTWRELGFYFIPKDDK